MARNQRAFVVVFVVGDVVGLFIFVEEGADRSDIDAIRNESAFETEAALSAQVSFEVSAVHALALFTVLHAQVESVGRLDHVDRHQQDEQQRD